MSSCELNDPNMGHSEPGQSEEMFSLPRKTLHQGRAAAAGATFFFLNQRLTVDGINCEA